MCLRKGYIVEFCISAKTPILAYLRSTKHKNQLGFFGRNLKSNNLGKKSSTPSFLGAYLLAQWAVASPHPTTVLASLST
jgi:hypothetical protein